MIRWLCVGWIAAISCIGLTQSFFQYCHASVWWFSLFFALLFYYLLWFKDYSRSYFILSLLLKSIAVLSIFALGWSYADHQLKQRLADEVQYRQTVQGIVYIQSISDGKLENWRQNAELLIPNENRSLKILLYPKRIYNAAGEAIGLSTEKLQLGQFYQVIVDIKPPHGYVNPGGFDQEKWLLQNGIHGTATVLYSQPLSADEIQRMGWYRFVVEQQRPLAQWRLWIEQLRLSYRQQLVGDTAANQNKALLLGLLTGDRSGISKDSIELYQMMGISHLLAISGPHVLILAAMLTWVLMQILHALMRRGVCRNLYQYIPKPYVCLPIFLLCVSFYVAFTGFEIPALRTWIMVFICSLALLLRIRISPFTTLLCAACVVLWWDCFAILSAAFWLSFGASAILLLIYQQVQEKKQEPSLGLIERFKVLIALLWQSQWRIFIALLPIVLWQFQAVSLISPVINLIAIPFLSLVIVPLDIIAALIWLIIPSFGHLIWSMAAFLLAMFNHVLLLLQPVAAWLYLPSYLNVFALLSLSIGIILISLPKGLIPRYWAAFFILLTFIPQKRALLQFDILDVGQGQATLLRTANHQLLIDTGGPAWQEGQASMGDRVIVPFLRSQGIRSLDEILLSHLDLDHSGGAAAVIDHIRVKQLRSNSYDKVLTNYPAVPFIRCDQGQAWQWDGVNIEILFPRENYSRRNQNESSCVVLIQTEMLGQPFKILVMGDLGWEGEFYLLQDYPDLTADILVLGHHGSRHSSAYDFLAQVNPKLAVISAGFDNRYGHPTPETLARLQALNIAYVNTADLGAIHIELKQHQSIWSWQSARATRQWLLPKSTALRLDFAD
ncbi:DNA internalization-related competence protein ComEC/Rec2 [Acinetobacter populi]|uniref:DNA internalization-related competence protein ComEC/Rec2 n=1 Tax=Acinetobacter populi TaxID=1582270 RepID=A0A1Z9YU20_9GAMM|nr:DNA internalization-related competence protein ComEC/Rec2 [Acinetobacter populi]OUY05716.1 DNA internalization-related competence protein ComEC/Rec2 [Acinetobacter populi]